MLIPLASITGFGAVVSVGPCKDSTGPGESLALRRGRPGPQASECVVTKGFAKEEAAAWRVGPGLGDHVACTSDVSCAALGYEVLKEPGSGEQRR